MRWQVRRILERWPGLFLWIMRRRRQPWQIVDSRTDLVMEGYQSSANSFARRAMKAANPDARLASHLHSWAQVARAVELGKPVMVLLRAPEDAVASTMVRFGLDDPSRELARYATFYGGVARQKGRYVVAPFAEVTTRFGDVIRRVNDTFGTAFVPFDHDDPAKTEEIFAAMDRHDEATADGIWTTARPLAERHAATAAAKARLSAPEYAQRLARCKRLHDDLLHR